MLKTVVEIDESDEKLGEVGEESSVVDEAVAARLDIMGLVVKADGLGVDPWRPLRLGVVIL